MTLGNDSTLITLDAYLILNHAKKQENTFLNQVLMLRNVVRKTPAFAHQSYHDRKIGVCHNRDNNASDSSRL